MAAARELEAAVAAMRRKGETRMLKVLQATSVIVALLL
jgi:hypothetical protein